MATAETSDTDEIRDSPTPNRDATWGEPTDLSGATVRNLQGSVTFEHIDRGRERRLGSNQAAYFLEGVEDYLDENADCELDVPDTYGEIDEFETYVGEVTAASPGFGWGLSSNRLEAIIRLVTGGGRYSADDITLIGCHRGIYAEGPRGEFLVVPEAVGRPEGFDAPTSTVRGLEVEEDSERVREGIEAFLDAMEHTDVDVVGYCRNDGRHVFQTADGGEIRISTHSLADLRRMASSVEEVTGPYEYRSVTTEVQGNDIEYEPGTERHLGTIVGYNLSGRTAGGRHPRKQTTVYHELEYVYLSISESSSGYRARTTDTSTRLTKTTL